MLVRFPPHDASQTISRIHRLRCQAARIIFGVTRHVSAMRCRRAVSRVYDSASLTRESYPEEAEGGRFRRWTLSLFPWRLSSSFSSFLPHLPESRLLFSFRIGVPVGEWENERDLRRTTCPWPIQFFPPRPNIRRAPSYVNTHTHTHTCLRLFLTSQSGITASAAVGIEFANEIRHAR